MVTEMTLVDQERGKEWEYRIVAINKSGEGEPSNTVMVVLQRGSYRASDGHSSFRRERAHAWGDDGRE